MDLWDLTKLLFRRWLISVPILLLSVVVLIVASQTVKPDFRATGHVIIVSPAQTTQDLANASPNKVHNPWEDLGFRALAQTALLKVQSKDVLAKMLSDGFSDNITLALDDRSPVITIEAVAHSPEVATATIQEIIKNLDQAVSQAQTVYGVQKDSLFTAYPIDSGDSVETVTSTQKRVMAVIGGIGLIATVALTIIVDAWLRRRARRKQIARAGTSTDETAVIPAQRTKADKKDAKRIGSGSTEDDALSAAINALGNRRVGADAPSAGSGPGAKAEGDRNGRVLTVDYKVEDGKDTKEAKPSTGDVDEESADATVVLPLTSLWGGQESKRRRL